MKSLLLVLTGATLLITASGCGTGDSLNSGAGASGTAGQGVAGTAGTQPSGGAGGSAGTINTGGASGNAGSSAAGSAGTGGAAGVGGGGAGGAAGTSGGGTAGGAAGRGGTQPEHPVYLLWNKPKANVAAGTEQLRIDILDGDTGVLADQKLIDTPPLAQIVPMGLIAFADHTFHLAWTTLSGTVQAVSVWTLDASFQKMSEHAIMNTTPGSIAVYAELKNGTPRCVVSQQGQFNTTYDLYDLLDNGTNSYLSSFPRGMGAAAWGVADYFPLPDDTGRLLWSSPQLDVYTLDAMGSGGVGLAMPVSVPGQTVSISLDASGVVRVAIQYDQGHSLYLCSYASEADLATIPSSGSGWGIGKCASFTDPAFVPLRHAIQMPW